MHNYIYRSINIYSFSSKWNGLLTIKIYKIIKSQMEKVLVSESDWEFALHHYSIFCTVCLFVYFTDLHCHVPYATLSIFYIIIFSFLFNVLFYFFLHVLICIFVIVAFLCMCVCVCMCVCICICVCMYIYIYIYIYICVCMYVYIYVYIDLYLSVFLRSTVCV